MPHTHHLCPNCFNVVQIDRPCTKCTYHGKFGVGVFMPATDHSPVFSAEASRYGDMVSEAMLREFERSRETLH